MRCDVVTHASAHTVGTSAPEDLYDVVIVGYGPVGRMLALKLGARSHRVLVLEKQETTYFLPRAVHIDDEAARILQSVGAGPDQLPDAVGPYDDFYEWRNAAEETLLRLDWRGRGPSGWNVSNFFNQPQVERYLDGAVQQQATVNVAYGWQATDIVEEAGTVAVSTRSASGETGLVRARYLVGADGANSRTREWIGGSTTDLGYFHDWLVVDLVMRKNDVMFSPPAWQLCDPSRPTTLVPGGPGRRRFEFMRLPSESRDELAAESTAWKLLEPWGIAPEDAELERHTVYTFQARWNDEWRRGRVLIAGDAAHLMPPFAGQGMCSGLRDAVNLEWKLDLVLRGLADDDLLDTYGAERTEHVRHFIEASMALGEVICITDAQEAARRDRTLRSDFLAGTEPEPRPLPRLGEGLFEPDGPGGQLGIQPVVTSTLLTGLFDDATGGGGVLLVSDIALAADLDAACRADLTQRGVRVVALGSYPALGIVVDTEGAWSAWLASAGAVAVLVRPDFYVFGIAREPSEVAALAGRFVARLSAKALA
jgi:2-polyprenyl-6-methoxyphenol hydroxylase-like FAD-dependent oxidoreductase